MKIVLNLTRDQIDKLNSKEVKYFLGDDEDVIEDEWIKDRIIDILNHINDLTDAANQYDYLDSLGVDNWSEYGVLSYENFDTDNDYDDL